MPRARRDLAVGVVNGKLYAMGGWHYDIGPLDWVDAYDPVTNTWTSEASMPTAREDSAVGVVSGTLFALGGNGINYKPLNTNEGEACTLFNYARVDRSRVPESQMTQQLIARNKRRGVNLR